MLNSKGFTLIEVLVSMLILAIGLLGLAGLQMNSLKNNQSAFMRTQATILAYNIADRMRANVTDASLLGASTYIQTAPTAAAAQAGCTAVAGTCTTAQMAQQDLFEWNTDVEAILPRGNATIAINGTTFTVTIQWDDERDGNNNSGSLALSFQL